MNVANLDLLWAKSARGSKAPQTAYRPLRYHLIDAACVAEVLWDECIPLGRRAFFTERVGFEDVRDLRTIAVVAAGLHDVGKCNPRFQAKHRHAPRNLFGVAHEPEECDTEPNHAYASGRTAVHPNHALGTMFADILRGHHGRYQRLRHDDDLPFRFDEHERGWLDARHALTGEIFSLFGKPKSERELPNEVALWLSGFVVACDWIASTSSVYRPEHDYAHPKTVHSAADYIHLARKTASETLKAMGWLARPRDVQERTFAETFGFESNIGQDAILDAIGSCEKPSITLVEYPTGYGKSETALAIAARVARAQDAPGMFFALPTRSSSDPMYERATAWISKIHPQQGPVQIQLLHGTAAISKTLERMTVLNFNDGYEESGERGFAVGGDDGFGADCCEADGPMIASWFGRTKRGMLAPYAVGTVDQLLIAGLAAKHTPLRIFGLGCKSTVIVDEVHAYDRYMTEILEVVLAWLGRMGVSVVLLSATMTEELGKRLVGAWLGRDHIDEPWTAYPRFAHAKMGERIESIHVDLGDSAKRTIAIDFWPSMQNEDGHERFFAEIPRLKREGGRYVVMCNTVKSAQELFRKLRDSGCFDPGELELYHARLIEKTRQTIHSRIESRCGKDKPRDGLLIVVSTQLLEASIDVDFDEAWSEIAPLEALLQRAGRMHRHRKNDPNRPPSARVPKLHICGTERKRAFHPYDDYDVLRTISVLTDLTKIRVPEDISRLIERVYADDEVSRKRFEAARRRNLSEDAKREEGANLVAIRKPRKRDYDTLYKIFDRANGPDDPETSTRWNAAGIRVVILDPALGPGPYHVDTLIDNSLVVSSKAYIADIAANFKNELPPEKILGPVSILHNAAVVYFPHGCPNLQRDTSKNRYEYDPVLGLMASRR